MVESNSILAAQVGLIEYPAPVLPIKVGLVTVMGTKTTEGEEVEGGDYTRQDVTFAYPADEVIVTNETLAWVNMPDCIVVGVEEWDSAPTPVRRWFGELATPKPVNLGDTFTIAAGAYAKKLR